MSANDRFGLAVVVAFGALVRFFPVVGAAATVGDGGLFLSMVDDLRASGMALPATTSYNDLAIPFVYPPLSLIVAGILGEMSSIATVDLLRWLPPIISTASLVAFGWVAWRLLPPSAAMPAIFTYALMPHAYDWVVAGGGITRGMGLLFALLAMGVSTRGHLTLRTAAASGVLLGLAALSHPQAAILGVIACLVLSWRRPFRTWLVGASVAAVCALLVVLPWLATVLAMHGPDAFLSAGHRFEPVTGLIRMLNLRFSGAPFMDLFAVLGVLGLLVSIARRQLRFATLLLATYLAGAGGGEFLAAVPWALLAGVGGGALVGVLRNGMNDLSPRARRLAFRGFAGAFIFLALIGSLGSVIDRSSKLHALTAEQISAMEWLAGNAATDTRVIVPTSEVWGDDEVSEWLPALALRTSVGTVQGSEWLGPEAFEAQLHRHEEIRACAGSTVACYRAVDAGAWIFAPKGRLSGPFSPSDCCPALRATFTDAGYEVIYDGWGATIARPPD